MNCVTSRGHRALPALAVAGWLVLSGGPAVAGGVAILAYRAAEAPATVAGTTAELARAIRESGSSPVAEPYRVAGAQLAAGAVPRQRLTGFATVARLTEEGWRAYLAVEANFAAARLSEARRAAERLLDLDGGIERYADISLRLGAVQLYLGRAAEADQLFALAARLAPERAITIAEFAPDVVAAYGAAAAAERPRVAVELTVPGVERATVEVDGRLIGPAPQTLELAVGQHVMVARAPGYTARGRGFAVTADGGRVELGLDRDPLASALLAGRAALAVGTDEEPARTAVTALVRYGDFDGVLLVATVWRRGAPALLGQWCSGLPARCGRVTEIGYPDRSGLRVAARTLWQDLDRGGGFPPTLLVDARLTSAEKAPVENGKHPPPHGRRWWKWAVAGVGAAALTVGAILLATQNGEDQLIVGVDPCQFGGCQ